MASSFLLYPVENLEIIEHLEEHKPLNDRYPKNAIKLPMPLGRNRNVAQRWRAQALPTYWQMPRAP